MHSKFETVHSYTGSVGSQDSGKLGEESLSKHGKTWDFIPKGGGCGWDEGLMTDNVIVQNFNFFIIPV